MAIYRPPMTEDGAEQTNAQQVQTSSTISPQPQDNSTAIKSSRLLAPPRRSSSMQSLVEFASSVNENKYIQYLNKCRIVCGDIVNHPKVTIFIIILIVVNAIMMGIATFDFVSDNPKVEEAFEKTDLAFLIIFTIELGMQFIYRGYTLFTWMDGLYLI